MVLFSWLQKRRQCDDALTRLGSHELADLQHHGRHVLIALRMQHRVQYDALVQLWASHKKYERILDRLEAAFGCQPKNEKTGGGECPGA